MSYAVCGVSYAVCGVQCEVERCKVERESEVVGGGVECGQLGALAV